MINGLRADSDYKAHTILTFTSANMLSVFMFFIPNDFGLPMTLASQVHDPSLLTQCWEIHS